MLITLYTLLNCLCRPPHGGRGLKCLSTWHFPQLGKSSSPRRAWIEIDEIRQIVYFRSVSSSPRRAWIEIADKTEYLGCRHGRPPHGGRGLKYHLLLKVTRTDKSSSPRRAWIEILSFYQLAFAVASPSPRRAWIEILCTLLFLLAVEVALPTEGVD